MRVGISGTHGTGKTTLAGALCAHLPGHVTADEPYYLLKEEGHEFGFPPSLEDYRALLARSLQSLSSLPLLPGVVLTGRPWTTSPTWPRPARAPPMRPVPQRSGRPSRASTDLGGAGDGSAAGGSMTGAGCSVTGAGGSIVFVLASSVRVPLAELAISNGLFPGLAGVVKTLAGELGPAGIRVNGLLPVRIATDRVRELDALQGDPDEVRARLSEHIPLRRYGEPEEFGRAAAFVLSPAASYITGAMIPVDGGAISSI